MFTGSPKEHLRQVLEDFNNELNYLFSQNILTKLDVQKLQSQAEVSKNAMLTARDEASFNDKAKTKLLNALILDFEKSIQRTLDSAVSRKSDKALLLHRLNRADKNLVRRLNISPSETIKLQYGLDMLKMYILETVSQKSGRWGMSPKFDVGKLATDYERAVAKYLKTNFTQPKFLK